jgi:hypothetical protein
MAGTWTTEKFPRFEQAMRKLTEQHRDLKDEPLLLAISYGPARDPRDIFLLEVIGNDTEPTINPDRELFEVIFTPTPGFPMDLDQRLHLILTNPQELKAALQDHWPAADEIIAAIRSGDYRVLHADKTGKRLLKNLQIGLQRKNGAARG